MWTVLRCIFNWNQYICHSILHNMFHGSITAKGDLSMEYFEYNGILCRFGMDVWVIPR